MAAFIAINHTTLVLRVQNCDVRAVLHWGDVLNE